MKLRVRSFLIFWLLCWLTLSVQAQGVRAVVVNEFVNVRTVPAIGATVIDSAPSGFVFEFVTARSADSQWLRVIYGGEEGWVNLAPLTVLSGDVSSLPVADPRTIPYGGNEAPRAGSTNAVGPVVAAATDGLRVRTGPSTAYPQIANINFNQIMTLTGRTASGTWYQVSFEGTLGWVAARFVRIVSGDVMALPIDGIVAAAPPQTGRSVDDFVANLRLILDRLNLAQDSLNVIRAYWTDAALTGRASCAPYPPQPSALNLPIPVLQAFFNELDPIQRDFDDAMANIRLAIRLFIEVCNQPGTGNPVGQATVQGALDTVNLAEQQVNSLRGRVQALIPPTAGANECVLTYAGRTELLPIINVNQLYLETYTRRYFVSGYCFDAPQGKVINIQTLPLPKANVRLFVALSPLDTPANFLAVNTAGEQQRLSIGPITLPRTTRYLLMVADLGTDRAPDGRWAFQIFDAAAGITQFLAFDTNTGAVILTADPGTGIGGPVPGAISTPIPQATAVVCPSLALTCSQLFTCAEAAACLQAGNFSLDGDNDGFPCEGPPLNCGQGP
ncbi:MAG: SH3 domain-containing protein [Anaerolineae bacterium]|nr:SH3 domain-containing protein [Anaerolineae bacterium]MDW8173454.1 SH3 domain-containing protein [Anaerolineae bacterium]